MVEVGLVVNSGAVWLKILSNHYVREIVELRC